MPKYKKLSKINDYNYTNEYDYKQGKWDQPVRTRCDLKTDNRDEILRYLHTIGLVEKYSLKLFKSMYTSIANQYDDLYKCFEFQEYLGNIWLIICEVPQEKWTTIWYNNGRTGITAYVSGIIHRTIISTSSHSYRDVFRHSKDNVNYNDDEWRMIQEKKSPEELDVFEIGSW